MIHPSAVVHPSARLASTVSVGPYSIIGPEVEVGADTSIASHVVIQGRTRIGAGNRIHPFCSLGGPPQDMKYAGEPTSLEIGDRNTIREFCTFNCGTVQDAGVTRLGDDNWIMAYVHLAHDCRVGNRTIFANNAQLAGHVRVDDFAILGGYTEVHQFVQVGAHTLTAIGTVLLQDLPPYVTAAGNVARPHGINAEGLKRRGYSAEAIAALRGAYRTLYRAGLSLEEARSALEEQRRSAPEVGLILEFLARSRRGIVR
ncbi:MAG: acyl-ACP--UDP-N-acetylglucosamine O-acyltransferase [Burkholderiales bacterium]|nr:acyl-ACP--UDP-N-acetylglucosamine O-acyltransferase [Burkholderiales bacterium]